MLKALSAFVGWLNVMLGILLPILWLTGSNSLPATFELLRYSYTVPIGINSTVCKIPLFVLSWLLLLWPMSSLLLVQGITQNRRSSMVPWICLNVLLVIVLVLLTFPHWTLGTEMSYDSDKRLVSSMAFLTAIGFFLFCLIIVAAQYKKMRKAPIILPLQCPKKTEIPEETPMRYMPIFK